MKVSFLCLACLAFLVGCGAGTSESKEPSEIIDVPPALDIPIANDQVAAPRAEQLSGIMPSNFPSDLPLHQPSSLVNFGDGDGGPWVELLSSDPRGRVEQGLLDALGRAGWSADRAAGTIELRQNGRRARLTVSDGHPGTLYRYVY